MQHAPNASYPPAQTISQPPPAARQGCQIGSNVLFHGDIVATVDGVPSAKDCCRECTARNVEAGRRECTVFNFCGQAGGCNYTHQQDESKSVVLQQGQCEYTRSCTSGNKGDCGCSCVRYAASTPGAALMWPA